LKLPAAAADDDDDYYDDDDTEVSKHVGVNII
jgi:hypothetical protein